MTTSDAQGDADLDADLDAGIEVSVTDSFLVGTTEREMTNTLLRKAWEQAEQEYPGRATVRADAQDLRAHVRYDPEGFVPLDDPDAIPVNEVIDATLTARVFFEK
ncbi:MAG: hypothetical protein M3328_13640 [Chloroflexota bacterium]|nr:hypothetical protein [Chloroflexota bacterium]